jgi:hypothetical protein
VKSSSALGGKPAGTATAPPAPVLPRGWPGRAAVGLVTLNATEPARVIVTGHAFVQNLRRGHDELGVDALRGLRLAAAFAELSPAI